MLTNNKKESFSQEFTLLSLLSHELPKPITKLVYRNDFIIRMANKNKDSYTKEMLLNEMKNNITMCMIIKYIIKDVEYICSLSKGNIQYFHEMTDVSRLIQQSIHLCEFEAAETKGVTIKTMIDHLPPLLYVDKERMMSVFINLIKNAVRYANNNSEIIISYNFNNETKYHEIDFSDWGIGVEPEDEEKIFSLFYRTRNAMETFPNGTGIGLFLVKEIMKAHNGDCYVKKYNNPTIFTISIPNNISK